MPEIFYVFAAGTIGWFLCVVAREFYLKRRDERSWRRKNPPTP